MAATSDAASWPAELSRLLIEAGIEIAAWVPDKRLAAMASALIDSGVVVRTLTREEECIGFAAGFRAAGGSPAVLMQCSGVGNALNALGSLAMPYGLGFPIILSMRGTLGERNRAQVDLGRSAASMLALLGIQSFSVRANTDLVAVARGAVALADGARQVSAIILEPDLDLRG